MNITILGSGGFLPTPLPTCVCRICRLARKNSKDARRGSSFFIHDLQAIIDTPEDIGASLNACAIREVKRIFFSHWHPDHTLGFRIVESLRPLEFVKKQLKPIEVFIPSYEIENIRRIIPSLWYFEEKKHIRIISLEDKGMNIAGLSIRPIRLMDSTFSAFEMMDKKKRVVLCPDHSKLFPVSSVAPHPDLLITNLGYFETNLKWGERLSKKHRIHTLTSFQDNLRLIGELNPKQVVLTHIEERWNRTPEELNALAQTYKAQHVRFGTDGMRL